LIIIITVNDIYILLICSLLFILVFHSLLFRVAIVTIVLLMNSLKRAGAYLYIFSLKKCRRKRWNLLFVLVNVYCYCAIISTLFIQLEIAIVEFHQKNLEAKLVHHETLFITYCFGPHLKHIHGDF